MICKNTDRDRLLPNAIEILPRNSGNYHFPILKRSETRIWWKTRSWLMLSLQVRVSMETEPLWIPFVSFVV